jgi:hypothetical protein
LGEQTVKHKPAKPAVHHLSAAAGPTKGGIKVSSFASTAAPEPATAITGDIYAVSCAGPTCCVAVGVAPTSDTGGIPTADSGTA